MLLAGLAGCGGDHAPKRQPEAQLRLADCAYWSAAGRGERRELIRQIRNFAGGPVGTSTLHGATLPDREAYRLFENYCRNDFARGFKLYRLYTRAAAFRRR